MGEARLAEDRLARERDIRPEPVRKVWKEHLAGHRDAQDMLWNVLMFQSWLDQWMPA